MKSPKQTLRHHPVEATSKAHEHPEAENPDLGRTILIRDQQPACKPTRLTGPVHLNLSPHPGNAKQKVLRPRKGTTFDKVPAASCSTSSFGTDQATKTPFCRSPKSKRILQAAGLNTISKNRGFFPNPTYHQKCWWNGTFRDLHSKLSVIKTSCPPATPLASRGTAANRWSTRTSQSPTEHQDAHEQTREQHHHVQQKERTSRPDPT